MSVKTDPIQKFETIKYTTSSGEDCVATKNNGVVTIRGNKNGVRQMPLQEFLPEFIKDQTKKGSLERIPQKDTVSFNGKSPDETKNSNNKKAITIGALVATPLILVTAILSRGKGMRNVVNQAEKKVSGVADDIAETLNKGKASDKVQGGFTGMVDDFSELDKGIYGQNIYDPLDPMNAYDVLSPYYKPPIGSFDDVSGLGGGFDSGLGGF